MLEPSPRGKEGRRDEESLLGLLPSFPLQAPPVQALAEPSSEPAGRGATGKQSVGQTLWPGTEQGQGGEEV